jgi:hypothetical protein
LLQPLLSLLKQSAGLLPLLLGSVQGLLQLLGDTGQQFGPGFCLAQLVSQAIHPGLLLPCNEQQQGNHEQQKLR